MKESISLISRLTIIYFVFAFIEVIAEYFMYQPLIIIFKPFIPIILILLYWLNSSKRQMLFLLSLFFLLITNVLFIQDSSEMIFFGIIAFHRILSVILVYKMAKIKDHIPLIIATIPFLLIFLYLFLETKNIPENSIVLILFLNTLISIYAGIALSNYFMNDNKQNSILLISALLFMMLQFVVFIEKYYLINEYTNIFRSIAMSFNALAFFSYYKYVINAEISNND
jgi:hypothetical protein